MSDESTPPGAADVPQPVFYRINPRPISYGEYRMSDTALNAAFARVLVKVFRLPLPVSADDPPVESLAPFETPPERVRDNVRQMLEPAIKGLGSLGFNSPIWQVIDDPLHAMETTLVSLAHPTLPVVARIHIRYWWKASTQPRSAFSEYITPRHDGTFLWTVSSRPNLKVPPSCTVVRKVGGTFADLLKMHQEALAQGGPIEDAPADSRERVLDICERHHAAVRDFHLGRGVFVARTIADNAKARALEKPIGDGANGASKHPQVIHELDRLLTKKGSWAGALVLLVLSLGVFLAVGLPGEQSFLRVLALVPILLFHELGHYLAMRACGYRNLRMFFIPGFGAAVSGRAFNVPAWKRAVVALMGPVPGVIAGIIVGLCGIVAKSNFALDAALLMVSVNGFNLLPVLPLDGGQVLHAVLFSRHYLLDVIFRGAAALGLLALSVVLHSNFFIFIGVFVLVGIPLALRTARTAAALKKEGFRPVSTDDQRVPVDAAERIADRLVAGSKRPVAAKVLAQQTLEVFETLNTRPAGWLSGIGLVTVQGVFLVASLVFGVVFIAARQGHLQDMLSARSNAPQHLLSPDTGRSTGTPAGSGPWSTVIATFPRGKAAATYDEVSAKLGPVESATLLGDTVMIRFASSDDQARKRWMADMTARAPDAFVDGTTLHATFRFQFQAPDEETAKKIEGELADFLSLPVSEGLIPPWGTPALTPDQARARRTYRRLEEVNVYKDPAITEFTRKVGEARKRGEEAESKALLEQQRAKIAELRCAAMQRIADDGAGDVDVALAREYMQLDQTLAPEEFYKKVGAALAPRLGQLGAQERALCVRSGWSRRMGRSLRLDYVQFDDPTHGAAALAAWLNGKQCTSLHYDVSNTPDDEEDE